MSAVESPITTAATSSIPPNPISPRKNTFYSNLFFTEVNQACRKENLKILVIAPKASPCFLFVFQIFSAENKRPIRSLEFKNLCFKTTVEPDNPLNAVIDRIEKLLKEALLNCIPYQAFSANRADVSVRALTIRAIQEGLMPSSF